MTVLRDEEVKSKLLELYPDGVVKNLRTHHHSFYQIINKVRKKKGLELDDYIKQLGLQNITIKKSIPQKEKTERVLNSLYETFPDKKIPKSLFNEKGIYKKLYRDLYNIYKKDYHNFLTEHQFIFVDIDATNYDCKTIDLLQKEYDVNIEAFSQLFNLSKRNIDILISQKNTSKINWIVDDLEQDKLNVFKNMIITRTTHKIIENETFYICSNRNVHKPKFAFIYILKKHQEVISCQCLLNIPETLIQLLKYHHYHLLQSSHLEYLHHFVQKNNEAQSKNTKYYVEYIDRLYISRLIRSYPNYFKDLNSLKTFFQLEHIDEKRDEEYRTMYNLIESYYIPELDAVYIPPKDRTNYDKVSNTGRQKYNLKMKDFVESFGFIHKGKLSASDIEKLNYNYTDEKIDKELYKLQKRVKDTTIPPQERASRSRKLVELLKKSYEYKCQLCDENSPIPPIILKDGRYYVEVHHIIALHHQDPNDESDIILDNYKNAMVVCPYHHKYLHYHLGGKFEEIKREKNNYYIVNEHEKLLIRTNHHLEENHDLLKKLPLSN